MVAGIFADRCAELMRRRKLTQGEVCTYLQKSHGYLGPHLAGRSTPTLSDIDGIARFLGTHPNYLSGWSNKPERDAPPNLDTTIYHIAQTVTSLAQFEIEERPTIERMTYLYIKGGANFTAFEPLASFFDLFIPPSASHDPIPVWAGEESLSTIAIGRRGMPNNAAHLQANLEEYATPEIKADMAEAHSLAEAKGHHSSICKMDLPTRDGRIRFDYKRELYLVRRGAEPFILSFCKAVG